jgi:SAM-dependent methyltransferase
MNQDKIWAYFQSEGLAKFSQSVPRLRFLLKEAQKFSDGRLVRVLNIGVGDAWLERHCLELGWETYSLDPDEAAISRLKPLGIKARAGPIENIPYDDNFFDVTFCSEVVEHLSAEHIQSGLSEINRVLKTDGVLLGTVPFREELLQGQVVCPDCGNIFHYIGHQQSFDLESLASVFPASLKVEQIKAIHFPDWRTLNWKGKLVAVAKKSLLLVGIHGVNENIYFKVRKVDQLVGNADPL